MFIFQLERFLIRGYVKKYGHYMTGKILDAGSGSHQRYKNYFKPTEYTTLDLNKNFKPDIVASVEKIPLGNSSIDSIVCTSVLGDVYNPKQVIKEFNRVLKTGGYCLLTDNFFASLHDKPYDYYRFTNYFLEKVFKDNNFKILHLDKVGGFHSMIAQARMRYLILKYNLYEHKIIGWLASKLFNVYSHFMIFLDSIDKSSANKDFALGWVVIAKKK